MSLIDDEKYYLLDGIYNLIELYNIRVEESSLSHFTLYCDPFLYRGKDLNREYYLRIVTKELIGHYRDGIITDTNMVDKKIDYVVDICNT